MQDPRRPQGGGDIRGAEHGDVSASGGDSFTDWDNPEDEGAPEGYYDEADADDDESYVPTPDDPDYDLSEAAGYAGWEPPRRSALLPGWVIVVASILLIVALLLPVLIRIN